MDADVAVTMDGLTNIIDEPELTGNVRKRLHRLISHRHNEGSFCPCLGFFFFFFLVISLQLPILYILDAISDDEKKKKYMIYGRKHQIRSGMRQKRFGNIFSQVQMLAKSHFFLLM